VPLVTRCATSRGLTASKHRRLAEIARLCGRVRAEAWNRYGGLGTLARSNRAIRDEDWLRGPKLGERTGLPARVWKAALEDALNGIRATGKAAAADVVRAVWRSKRPDSKKKALSVKLRDGTWHEDRTLHRLMRKHWRRGHSSVADQIVLDVQGHKSFEHGGQRWIEVSSLEKRRRIAIPLGKFDRPITGGVRLRVRADGEVDVLYAVDEAEACVTRPCGEAEVGLDKGYSEVFADSDGERHGEGFGELLSAESDRLKAVWAARRKLKAVAEKAARKGKFTKAERVRRHNLGRQKLTERKRRHRQAVRGHVYHACHSVLDKAGSLVVEDLRRPIRGYDRGRNQNRRLSGWVKGLVQEAVETTSRRRGASVDEVNAAYTSQWLPGCASFGKRAGDAVHCPTGRVVCDADTVAAVNILQRKTDEGIGRFLPYREVRRVLEGRSRQAPRPCEADGRCGVDGSCLRLPRRDSSCGVSARAETAINGERINSNEYNCVL